MQGPWTALGRHVLEHRDEATVVVEAGREAKHPVNAGDVVADAFCEMPSLRGRRHGLGLA